MGLKYIYKNGQKPCIKEPLRVERDGRGIGEIRKADDGFEFFARGEKKGRGVFDKLSEVQNDLQKSQPARSANEENEDNDLDDANADKLKQAKKGLKNQEKQIKLLTERSELADDLLTAASELLNRQKENEVAVNLLDAIVDVKGTETDGHSILEDICNFLE